MLRAAFKVWQMVNQNVFSPWNRLRFFEQSAPIHEQGQTNPQVMSCLGTRSSHCIYPFQEWFDAIKNFLFFFRKKNNVFQCLSPAIASARKFWVGMQFILEGQERPGQGGAERRRSSAVQTILSRKPTYWKSAHRIEFPKETMDNHVYIYIYIYYMIYIYILYRMICVSSLLWVKHGQATSG